MGDPRKSKKKYVKPKRPFESDRFESELQLIGTYGLRNKKELWRHRAELSNYRRQARNLLALSVDERAQLENELLQKLTRLGFLSGTPDLDDVLDLSLEDVLERRLQTIVLRKGLACSPHHARQLVTHGHIVLESSRVTTPSRLITIAEEERLAYAGRSPLNDESHPARIAASAAALRAEAAPLGADMNGDDEDEDFIDEEGEAS